jgi:DMSO/TMAO reductase YedYZ heme-binding membrane subunit
MLLWYTARAGGIVSWALVTASITWGLALSTKVFGKRPRPSWLLDMHRYLGGLALVFTGVHVLSIVADSYVHFGLAEVLIPFASTWKPTAVAWGIVGFYLLLAVELTSLARRQLPKSLWRSVHYASFPLFVVATVHGVTAGTDAAGPALFVALFAAIFPIVGLIGVRLDQPPAPEPRFPARTQVAHSLIVNDGDVARPRPPVAGVPQPQ